jgi:hypothetical protein
MQALTVLHALSRIATHLPDGQEIGRDQAAAWVLSGWRR